MPDGLEEKIATMVSEDTSTVLTDNDMIEEATDSAGYAERMRKSATSSSLDELTSSAKVRLIRQVKERERDISSSLSGADKAEEKYIVTRVDTTLVTRLDSAITETEYSSVVAKALNQSKTIQNTLQINASKFKKLNREINKDEYESQKKVAQAISCLIMFLIGAPLGAIIKRGGLGLPVLISICFFIAFYVLTEISRKWADDLLMDASIAVWIPNMILLPFGIVFMLQARLDTRLLEPDFYKIWIDKLQKKIPFLSRKPAM